jgi:hypothetical protein
VSDDEAADREPPAPPPAKKKTKKRKKRAEGQLAPAAAPGAGVPAHWPEFARSFPRDPALDELVEAFEAGNYAAVRARAPELIHRTESDEVRAAARNLLQRLEPDPLAKLLLGVAALLLIALSFWYWTHPKGAP